MGSLTLSEAFDAFLGSSRGLHRAAARPCSPVTSSLFTLDFEASCLPSHGRSFPIEVGVADVAGHVRSWLIRPQPAWRDWTWTAEAERLHGLSWDVLVSEGLPAAQVLDELREVLGRQPAYADSYLDAAWMRTLEAAAGAPPMLPVRHIDALIDQLRLDDEAVARAVAATGDPARRHRAGEDALWLQRLVGELMREAQDAEAAALSRAA